MSTSRTSQPWAAAERRARRQLESNRQAIERSPRGIPAGGRSRNTTAAKGYVVITAQYKGTCLTCGKAIKVGRQVRYWFGHGITCTHCILEAT